MPISANVFSNAFFRTPILLASFPVVDLANALECLSIHNGNTLLVFLTSSVKATAPLKAFFVLCFGVLYYGLEAFFEDWESLANPDLIASVLFKHSHVNKFFVHCRCCIVGGLPLPG